MEMNEVGFMRLPQVLEVLPFSRSAWFHGVRIGLYPKPVHLSKRTTAWRKGDIYRLARELSVGLETKIDIDQH